MASQQFGGSNYQQPGWVPNQSTRVCSQGICSIYCPQWCFSFFPPPQPFDIAGDDDPSQSGPTFSPLVIAIIGILASACLLVTYYTIISRYCGRRDLLRSSSQPNRRHHDGDADAELGRHEERHIPPGDGLDETLISKISVYKYKRGEGLVDGTDCSVCLSEFRDDESLRLLPKCCHAFHVRCIDTWLKSHSSCPLCRASVVFSSTGTSPSPMPPPAVETQPTNETVIIVEEEEEEEAAEGTSVAEERCLCEELESESDGEDEEPPHGIVEVSGESSGGGGRMSIADVLRSSIEEELATVAGEGPSVHEKGEAITGRGGGRNRGLHGVMSPVAMKRSSNGRFFFSKQTRVRTSVFHV